MLVLPQPEAMVCGSPDQRAQPVLSASTGNRSASGSPPHGETSTCGSPLTSCSSSTATNSCAPSNETRPARSARNEPPFPADAPESQQTSDTHQPKMDRHQSTEDRHRLQTAHP